MSKFALKYTYFLIVYVKFRAKLNLYLFMDLVFPENYFENPGVKKQAAKVVRKNSLECSVKISN